MLTQDQLRNIISPKCPEARPAQYAGNKATGKPHDAHVIALLNLLYPR